MGLFDRMTGVQKPPSDTPARTAEELVAALTALNRPDAPWAIRPGDEKRVDLIAEWRLTEPDWHSFFARTNMDRTFQILLHLDPGKREVRSQDRQWKVNWADGAPRLTLAAEQQRGQVKEVSWGRTVGEAAPDYRFSTEELREPVRDTVLAAGWTWRPAVFSRL